VDWQSATIEQVIEIVKADLARCTPDQIAVFEKYRTPPYRAPLSRYGQDESVIVVAQKENEVVYWEDVEEGFNVSPLVTDGKVLEHWCNQDDLGTALNRWLPASDDDRSNWSPARRV
jgi:hypothetical protein